MSRLIYKGTDYAGTSNECPFPVGMVLTLNNTVNPSILWEGTVWQRFAQGRVVVGADDSDSDFVSGTEGGSKTVTLTTAQLPAHRHGSKQRTTGSEAGGYGYTQSSAFLNRGLINSTTVDWDTENAGGGAAHNNLQPYIAVNMWERTA